MSVATPVRTPDTTGTGTGRPRIMHRWMCRFGAEPQLGEPALCGHPYRGTPTYPIGHGPRGSEQCVVCLDLWHGLGG